MCETLSSIPGKKEGERGGERAGERGGEREGGREWLIGSLEGSPLKIHGIIPFLFVEPL